MSHLIIISLCLVHFYYLLSQDEGTGDILDLSFNKVKNFNGMISFFAAVIIYITSLEFFRRKYFEVREDRYRVPYCVFTSLLCFPFCSFSSTPISGNSDYYVKSHSEIGFTTSKTITQHFASSLTLSVFLSLMVR
jgi:hypothetical protein